MSADAFFLQSFLQTGEFFNRDYNTSRDRFLHDIQSLAQAQHCWSLTEQLHCDTAWIGEPNARIVVVMISGTHGIEGYCGSAIQRFISQAIRQQLVRVPKECAVLMIHALNPWGMAHYRRCDQDGIDLNRNFVDFSTTQPEEADYLNYLEQLSSAEPSQRYAMLLDLSQQIGQQRFDQIFSGGQYHCSWGPFYGGQKTSWSHRVIDDIIETYRLVERLSVVIDLHSGLGPWAFGELISDHTPGSAGDIFSQKLFESAVSRTLSGESFSVPKQGLLDYRWHQLMQKQGCYITLEFGSYGTEALFNTLLDDHVLWREPDTMLDAQRKQQAQRMLDHFCPDDLLWQQAVLFKSWQVLQQSLTALTELINDHDQ